MQENKKLLITIKEASELTGWGEAKMREIANRKDSSFTIRCGRNVYIHRLLFEKYLESCAKYGKRV